VPIVRTFAPIIAGVGNMKYKNFITYNLFGGFVWSFGVIYAGYFLGRVIPDVDKYIFPIIILIIILSLLPILFEYLKSRKENK
jgi:membrane-associated protein